MLRSEKIIRVRIIASNSVRREVISALHDAGIMQLEDVSGEAAQLLDKKGTEGNYEMLSRELMRFRGLENAL
ncbi:MAG: hypothetical protein KIY12_02385, partial [Thermoplasmata archaeon]|nr:hypothetical protein [Candidatus Sysuiplasma superficiale]